jgi:dephospho-CoA kinase
VKVIGLTGGIGSGKSTVAVIFESLGVPVFNSDLEAKKLYQNKEVLSQVESHFGEGVIDNGTLSIKKLAGIIFKDQQELAWINNLIHPLVQTVFDDWKGKQEGDFVIKESAILLESGSATSCDVVITVEADLALRIQRVVKRDGVSEEEVKRRVSNQGDATYRITESDFVIYNNEELLKPQIINVLQSLRV